MNNSQERLRRAIRSVVLSEATRRLFLIILAVTVSFRIGYGIRKDYFQAVIVGVLVYAALLLSLICLDLSQRFVTAERLFNKLLKRLLTSHAMSESVRTIVKQEFTLRLQQSNLMNLVNSDRLERGLPRTVIDEVDEAVRIANHLRESLDADPSARVSIFAVHVTKAEVDEEFNYWRSLKAVDYLEKQRELLRTGRAQIWRFFITDRETLTLKALAVIAYHRYWGIRTVWGIRDRCNLPIRGYGNMLDASFQGRTPFTVAILVKSDTHDGAYRGAYQDQFITYWSFFDKPGIEPLSINLQKEFDTSLNQLSATGSEQSSFVEMTDQKIDRVLAAMDDEHAKAYLEFRKVRSKIPNAHNVTAVDLTSVKNSFSVLRQNPGYLEWQEACFKQILAPTDTRSLRRCYLVDPHKHDAIDNFIEILKDYFQRLAILDRLPPYVSVFYTSVSAVVLAIERMSEAEVTLWIDTGLANIRKVLSAHHHERGTQAEKHNLTGNYKLLFDLVARDFLYTEDFIYDYINPDARVDRTRKDDYLHLTNQNDLFSDAKREYEMIFSFLTGQCGTAKVTHKMDISRDLIENNLNSGSVSGNHEQGG
jgi:hypothetical protein